MPQTDLLALVALAVTLGVKHGLDADHLVAIDALTRFNLEARPRFARWCGVVFSLGHGAVVLTAALAAGALAGRSVVPEELHDLGAWISVALLTVLGALNLAQLWRTPHSVMLQPIGLRGRWLARLLRTSRPSMVALVGALFALSFDTLSQAALLAMSGPRIAHGSVAVLLAGAFTLGMTIADGANGAWIATMLRAADRRARVASRVMGFTIGALSLAIAAVGALRHARASAATWLEGRDLVIGLGLLAMVGIAYLAAIVLARRRMATAAPWN